MALDAPDARELARFYATLLGWEIAGEEPAWATIGPTDGVAYLAFQTSPGYERPVWPSADGAQQMMMHLDFQVDDLDAAVAHALGLGAQEAQHQPQDDVRVYLDRSISMRFGNPSKLEQAKKIAAALSYLGLKRQDRVSIASPRCRTTSAGLRTIYLRFSPTD